MLMELGSSGQSCAGPQLGGGGSFWGRRGWEGAQGELQAWMRGSHLV